MFSVHPLGGKIIEKFSFICNTYRAICSCRTFSFDNGYGRVEDYFVESGKSLNFDRCLDENFHNDSETCSNMNDVRSRGTHTWPEFSTRWSFIDNARHDAGLVLEILQQDGPGFDTKAALDDLQLRVTGLLVREVLLGILRTVSFVNKNRSAKLALKFFVWSGQQEKYKHTVSAYHLMLKIFAEAEEYKAMWRLVDEMTDNGYPTSARTFNILICTCGEAGLAKKVVERFIKSKSFNFRPFKHSFNAVLHSLLALNQYKLIEWVYEKMLDTGFSPDTLTYNIVMSAKHRLGKLDQFNRLLHEMDRNGLSPDFHTFNLLLHCLGKVDKPLAALKLLNHMKEVGCEPNVLHFTTLIDGLSRAGDLEASNYFFNEMIKQRCMPDVVCYTVMITGYVEAGEIDKAQEMFEKMISAGQLPNVFTYNAMIRGLCITNKFEEACLMLKEMELRGCNPNFLVYTTLVGYLRNAGKLSEAHDIMRHMVEKGQYMHLLSRIKRYRRC